MSYFARFSFAIAEMPSVWFFFDVALKATVLLCVATMTTAYLRRSSAAVRHRVWCLTFASLLCLPGLSAALPQWRLAVLPYRSPLAPREESRPIAGQVPASLPSAPSMVNERSGVEEPFRLSLAQRENYPAPLPRPDEPTTPQPDPAAAWPRAGITAIWFAGALGALLPLIVSWLHLGRLCRKGRAIDDADWRMLLDQLSQRLGLARRVILIETDAPLMPMAWGVPRPAILLPRAARDWPDRLRRIVLLHELAHIKRFDVGFQLLGRVACAVYWFHPLAWYGLGCLRIERELACDDCVVMSMHSERLSSVNRTPPTVSRTVTSAGLTAATALWDCQGARSSARTA